ncbi:MAG TPA: HNH endonuclease [Candidatus Brocadiia bacterium]|nr:HNH endonuclease [Candidatus Brocadiales bacterium]
MGKRENWSEKELIVAFNLYCKLPFGQYHKSNKKVIELAKIIGRTPSAVALKLCNFARLDPLHQKRGIKGMQHGGRLEEKIRNEFNQNWEELAYQSEIVLGELKGLNTYDLIKLEEDFPEGKVKEAVVKVRINQNFFRDVILASYRSKCAVCSLPEPSLLVASHIIPWSVNVSLRMNPRNGMCMCVLHDKAFDKGLITISDDYKLLVSKTIKKFSNEVAVQRGFIPYENIRIRLPDRFVPDKKFIEFHRNNVFVGQK